MPRSKTKLAAQNRVSLRTEQAFLNALPSVASTTTSLSGATSALPGDIQMQVDVQVCLLDAMTDNFPITRAEIDHKTVPSNPPIGADTQGWGICLASFVDSLHRLRPVYAFYVHKPRYTEETINKPFSDIVAYLKQKILAQF